MLTNISIYTGILIALITLTAVESQNQEPVPTSPYSKLAEYFYNKCWYNGDTQTIETFYKLQNASTELLTYFGNTIQLLPNDRQQFCSQERKQLEKLILEFSTRLKPCLKENEKFLSEFVKESFKEFLHFLCHNNGENINRFFGSRSKSCRTALNSDTGNSKSMSNCFSRIFAPTDGTLSKKETCDDINVVKRCFISTLDDKCAGLNGHQDYKELNEELFKYISKPCSGCINYISGLLLLVSLLISFFR